MDYEEGNKPMLSGLYVAYVNGPVTVSADRVLLMYMRDQGWYYPHSDQKYRDTIYGFVGPLPVLKLED